MNDKKILIALTPRDAGSNALTFTEKYIQGDNLDVTLFIVSEDDASEIHRDDLIDRFYQLCSSKGINGRVKEMLPDGSDTLGSHLLFSDLLIVEPHGLKILAKADHPNRSSCPILLVPHDFNQLGNILLVIDGSDVSRGSIKQFFLIFSQFSRDMDVTLLWVNAEEGTEMTSRDEMMLVEYIRQHCKNMGILKVQAPLTAKLMRPILYNHQTMVVGTKDFLYALGKTCSIFNPLEDLQASMFLSVK